MVSVALCSEGGTKAATQRDKTVLQRTSGASLGEMKMRQEAAPPSDEMLQKEEEGEMGRGAGPFV